MNFDRRYAQCIQKCYLRTYFTQSAGAGKRDSTFNRCNDANVGTREVPLVPATCDVINLPRTPNSLKYNSVNSHENTYVLRETAPLMPSSCWR